MGAGLDEDEGTGEAVVMIAVVNEGLGGAQANLAEIVEGQAVGCRTGLQRSDIDPVGDLRDDGLGVERGVLEQEFATGSEGAGMHPTDLGMEIGIGSGEVFRADDHLSATDIDIVL